MMVAGRFAQAAKGMFLRAVRRCDPAVVFVCCRGPARLHGRAGARVDISHDALGQSAAADRPNCDGRRCRHRHAVAALLSIDAVANLFKERVSLDQQYDVGQMGRFGPLALGALLALDVPFGIRPLQFSKIFPEDPHNSYLNAFMSGGWLSGVTYPTLVLITLAFDLRYSLVATQWQPTMIAVFSAYTGMMIESLIIDTDHWRHVFLLLGCCGI
jgi:hypothetical protein